MKKYNSIDLFKFIMAFLVVTIHTMSLPKNTDSFIWIILKSAVPFYFMTLGFLLNNKLQDSDDKLSIIKDYLKKIIRLYIIWSIIYIPITLYHHFTVKHSSILSVLPIIKNYLFKGEQFYSWPLWYLLCTIYSLVFIYILNKLKANKKLILLISVLLYTIGFFYTYMVTNITLYNGIIHKVLSILLTIFGSSGRLFQGILYINVGMLSYEKADYIKKYVFIWLISMCFLFVMNYLFNVEVLKVLLYFSIFILCISIELNDNKVYYYLRKTGVIMYFTHMIFFFVYSLFVGFSNSKGLIGFLFSIICTIVLSIILNIINKNNDKKVINTIFN